MGLTVAAAVRTSLGGRRHRATLGACTGAGGDRETVMFDDKDRRWN
eukprot:COSAG01_NODE_46522_length_399_cov_1.233333_1_plen_45_part_10